MIDVLPSIVLLSSGFGFFSGQNTFILMPVLKVDSIHLILSLQIASC